MQYRHFIQKYNKKIHAQKLESMREMNKSQQKVEKAKKQGNYHQEVLNELWKMQQYTAVLAKEKVKQPGPQMYTTYNAKEKKSDKYSFPKDRRVFEKMKLQSHKDHI